MQAEGPAGYVVPTYEAPATVAFYHFLHGNVPGHQIDFIYQPNVPQGRLTQQHFSHLARLVKYIEPRSRSAPAFAIGNLSRDDTQYEPGRGGVAFIIGLRIRGAKDHAGRQDPPFCHALAAIGRHLDTGMIFETSLAFYRTVLPDDEESQVQGSGWYHTYVQHAQHPDALVPILHAYVADFDELPAPPPSRLGLRWTVEGASSPRRIVIMHDDGAPFEAIAACAARIAGVLVESDIRWTVISTGRDVDVPGGISVRFVTQSEVLPEAADVPVWPMRDVPEDPSELAQQLFGAKEVRQSSAPELRVGWRQLYGTHSPDAIALPTSIRPIEGVARKSRAHLGLLVGMAVAIAIGGAVAAVAIETSSSPGPMAPTASAPPVPASPRPTQAETPRPRHIEQPEKAAVPPAAASTQTPAAAPVMKPPAGGSPLMRRPQAGASTGAKAGMTGKQNGDEKGKPRSFYAVPLSDEVPLP